jgi:hypothetical protein
MTEARWCGACHSPQKQIATAGVAVNYSLNALTILLTNPFLGPANAKKRDQNAKRQQRRFFSVLLFDIP